MADEEDKKPSKEAGGENSLNIRIRDQTGEETFFKVKKTTKLDKRVRGDQTPQDIDMDDGDQLDCMLEQQGR
ncbi:Cytidylyltransferase-like protein [Aureococcus anophagefferens]|nr:Cytidylyltransferase-like protein [Aureococcus anophagefferens]